MAASLRRIAANTGWLLGGKAVGALLSLFYLALATQTLGIEGFGHFALILGIGQTVTGFVTFQTWQLVVRYGMPLLERNDGPALDRLIGFAMMLDMMSALAGSLIAVGAVSLFAPHFGWSARLQAEACLFCLALLLSIRSTPIGILRLHDRYARAAMADAVTPIVRLLGALLATTVFPSVTGFLAAWAVAEVATAAAYWRAAARVQPIPMPGTALPRSGAPLAELWRFAWTSNASATLALSTRQVTLLITGLIGGPAVAGGYRLAAQLAQALAKFTASLSRAIFPELIRGHGTGPGEFRRLAGRITAWAMLSGAAIVALTALAGRPILHAIAGPEFDSAARPILLLAIAAAVDLAGVAYEPMLTTHGRLGLALSLRTVSTMAQLGALLLLLPMLGALGAAWATLIGSILTVGLGGVAAWRLVRDAQPANGHRPPSRSNADSPDPANRA
ncbi:polysaccharide biosynthesis protein [Sphingomonas oleivorans]|uniref:Polysaccharide biosynthesis protein n=1 Tax=Sphingomonas oleivorans TaxID=1735121 RepID=A0A2T5FUP6_9SPHN|nr:lipopolysaccharide biosynthesis protein [Sphingomonas oleivorans]PTQ08251.1 polysaccharide biosynthesis protein [Sphingomonas oleivorans]